MVIDYTAWLYKCYQVFWDDFEFKISEKLKVIKTEDTETRKTNTKKDENLVLPKEYLENAE